jgi:hypothetical protein
MFLEDYNDLKSKIVIVYLFPGRLQHHQPRQLLQERIFVQDIHHEDQDGRGQPDSG